MDNKEFVREDHAKLYSAYRRDIPNELLEIILSFLKEKVTDELQTAVDVGCGSGQSTAILAPHFKKVIGSDVSEAQINEAKKSRKLDNVQYLHQISEKIGLPDSSVQLITASSCLHWFDLDMFFPEARRVLVNNGVLAVYVYTCVKPVVNDTEKMKQIDDIIEEYYRTHLKPYWSPKSKIAFNLYKDINFPFEEVKRMYNILDVFDGQLSDLTGYMKTLSGFQKLKEELGDDAASKLLYNFKKRLCDVLGISPELETTPLTLCRDFMLVLCRKIDY